MRDLAKRFRGFADRECPTSPTYRRQAIAVAEDPDLLAVAALVRPDQPAPNLLFAAVRWLLHDPDQAGEPLAAHYRSVAAGNKPPPDLEARFRRFVLEHREALVPLLQTRRVQTNEVNRCAYLMPAFCLASRLAGNRPLALLEIGASAGFNLRWDRYQYRFNEQAATGLRGSPVTIRSDFHNDRLPPMPEPWPSIIHRRGVDLDPVDPLDAEAQAWLEALIWPEHADRRERLRGAIRIAEEEPVPVDRADGFADLENLVAALPADALTVVFHTHVANQLDRAARETLLERIRTLGAGRDLAHLFNNIQPHLHLTLCLEGKVSEIPLAHAEGHARRVDWIGPVVG
ncbi:MAG: DUF2332 domain-containing protein [Opitutales bacterium]